MSNTPGGNKPSNTKTTTPVKGENKNQSSNTDKVSKDSPKSDIKSGKSPKAGS